MIVSEIVSFFYLDPDSFKFDLIDNFCNSEVFDTVLT